MQDELSKIKYLLEAAVDDKTKSDVLIGQCIAIVDSLITVKQTKSQSIINHIPDVVRRSMMGSITGHHNT